MGEGGGGLWAWGRAVDVQVWWTRASWGDRGVRAGGGRIPGFVRGGGGGGGYSCGVIVGVLPTDGSFIDETIAENKLQCFKL